jgi:hypothetical protein
MVYFIMLSLAWNNWGYIGIWSRSVDQSITISGENVRRQGVITGGYEGNGEARITGTRTSTRDVTTCLFGDNIDEMMMLLMNWC